MSVYVEAIVPYNFREHSEKEKALSEIHALKEKFVTYYRLKNVAELLLEPEDELFDARYEVDLSLQTIDIELGNGFLLLTSGWNHSKYFYLDEENLSWLRCMFYDILKVLGCSEAYIVDEYHGTNHVYGEDKEFGNYNMTFEDWKNHWNDEFPTIPILPMDVLHHYEAAKWPEIECIYLDKYEDIKMRDSALQEKFPNLEILTTAHIVGNFLFALENDMPVLVNEKTGKIWRFGKIDNINNHFNTIGVEVWKGNKRAFYNSEGKKITPYRASRFNWEWVDSKLHNYEIAIIDEKTKKVIYKKVLDK